MMYKLQRSRLRPSTCMMPLSVLRVVCAPSETMGASVSCCLGIWLYLAHRGCGVLVRLSSHTTRYDTTGVDMLTWPQHGRLKMPPLPLLCCVKSPNTGAKNYVATFDWKPRTAKGIAGCHVSDGALSCGISSKAHVCQRKPFKTLAARAPSNAAHWNREGPWGSTECGACAARELKRGGPQAAIGFEGTGRRCARIGATCGTCGDPFWVCATRGELNEHIWKRHRMGPSMWEHLLWPCVCVCACGCAACASACGALVVQ